jgi:hypothetical protein
MPRNHAQPGKTPIASLTKPLQRPSSRRAKLMYPPLEVVELVASFRLRRTASH